MGLIDDLKNLGVNVEEALERLNGNASFYERMLGSFPAMVEASMVQPDFDGNDYAEITEKAHAIKGATGNLSHTFV